MSTFFEDLQDEFNFRAGKMGGDAAISMRKALENIRRKNLRIFQTFFLTFVLVLLLYLAFIVIYVHSDITKLAGATAAFGLASWKPFEFLLRAWDKWGKSELMMALIEGATSSQIQEMFKRVAAMR